MSAAPADRIGASGVGSDGSVPPGAAKGSLPPGPSSLGPPDSDVESIAWWDLKESRNPTPSVQLRAIAEIALALDAVGSSNRSGGGKPMHPHGALITLRGRAKLLPDLPLGALGDEERVLAPEVRKGGKPDARSDIFALGAMLYEALSDRAFTGAREVHAELERARATARRAPGEAPSWHADLLALAARATADQPSARGPQPRVIAKEILRLAGVDVATPEALGSLVSEAHSGAPPPARRRSSAGAVQAVAGSQRPDGRYKSQAPPADVVPATARTSSRPPSADRSSAPAESDSSRPTVPGSVPSSSRPTVPGSPPTASVPTQRSGTPGGIGVPRGGSTGSTTPGMASVPPPAASEPARASEPPQPSSAPRSSQIESQIRTQTGLARPAPDIPGPSKIPSRIPTATGMPVYRPQPGRVGAQTSSAAATEKRASGAPPGASEPPRSATPLGMGAAQAGVASPAAVERPGSPRGEVSRGTPAERDSQSGVGARSKVPSTPPPVAVGVASASPPASVAPSAPAASAPAGVGGVPPGPVAPASAALPSPVAGENESTFSLPLERRRLQALVAAVVAAALLVLLLAVVLGGGEDSRSEPQAQTVEAAAPPTPPRDRETTPKPATEKKIISELEPQQAEAPRAAASGSVPGDRLGEAAKKKTAPRRPAAAARDTPVEAAPAANTPAASQEESVEFAAPPLATQIHEGEEEAPLPSPPLAPVEAEPKKPAPPTSTPSDYGI